jgi:hypothetical protein
MASTYSSLKIQLMTTGENSGTWGNVTNVNLGTAIEEAIVGSADVTFSSADVTLTLTDSNSSQAARNLRLNLTGTVAAAQNLIVPAIEKVYIINNGLTFAITVKNASGSGIAVPAGKTMWVYNTGSNVVDVATHLSSLTLGAPLAIAQGGTGTNLTTFCNLQSNVSGVLPNANTTASASNGASTIVARDSSGNFATNTITANLVGNVTGLASNATFAVTAGNATNATTAVTATNATQIINAGSFNITVSGTKLLFSFNGTTVASLDSTGNFTSLANITAYGTP